MAPICSKAWAGHAAMTASASGKRPLVANWERGSQT